MEAEKSYDPPLASRRTKKASGVRPSPKARESGVSLRATGSRSASVRRPRARADGWLRLSRESGPTLSPPSCVPQALGGLHDARLPWRRWTSLRLPTQTPIPSGNTLTDTLGSHAWPAGRASLSSVKPTWRKRPPRLSCLHVRSHRGPAISKLLWSSRSASCSVARSAASPVGCRVWLPA